MHSPLNDLIRLALEIVQTGVVVLLGIIAGVLFCQQITRSSRWYRTWGEVIDVKVSNSGGDLIDHPVIQYRTLAGEEATFLSDFGQWDWRLKPGDRLEILANPSDPSQGQVVGFVAQWLVPLILAIMSGVSGGSMIYDLFSRH